VRAVLITCHLLHMPTVSDAVICLYRSTATASPSVSTSHTLTGACEGAALEGGEAVMGCATQRCQLVM
jgi:hypothetical protein